MDDAYRIFENSTLIIDKGRIVEMGVNATLKSKYKAAKVIDATGKLLMPGLINAHTHAAMTIFRGIADDIPLKEWLYEKVFPLEGKFVNAKTVEIGTNLAVAEMIYSGTTTFCDMYFFEDEVAQIVSNAGMRAVLSEGIIDYPSPNSKTPEEGLKYTETLINNWKNHPLVTIGVSAHSPYSCSPELLKKTKQLADKYSVPYNIHLAETQWEVDTIRKSFNYTPTQFLNSLGLLSDNVIAAHAVHLNEKDIELIAANKLGVAHNPQCNMKLASGVAPICELLANKVKVGLGTDGVASNNNLSMFDEMNTMALLHKISNNNSTFMDAKNVVKIATNGSAAVLGMFKDIGSIEVGKKADVIIIDMDKPHLIPLYNFYSHIVFSMNGSEVDSVIIDGKLVMENRQLLTMDIEKIKNEARELSKIIGKGI
jgi:5-methylthioadenosine/S-adenosylhomocysteine deaminase